MEFRAFTSSNRKESQTMTDIVIQGMAMSSVI